MKRMQHPAQARHKQVLAGACHLWMLPEARVCSPQFYSTPPPQGLFFQGGGLAEGGIAALELVQAAGGQVGALGGHGPELGSPASLSVAPHGAL